MIIVAFLFLNPTSIILSNETEKSQSQHTPEMRGYSYNLKQLLEKTERNLKEVDKKLKEEEIKRLNEEKEIQIRVHFEKGNQFYREGKFKRAKK